MTYLPRDEPVPIAVMLKEGGEWLHFHSVKFDDDSIWDALIGWQNLPTTTQEAGEREEPCPPDGHYYERREGETTWRRSDGTPTAKAGERDHIGDINEMIGSGVEGHAGKGLGLSRSAAGRTEAGTQALPPECTPCTLLDDLPTTAMGGDVTGPVKEAAHWQTQYDEIQHPQVITISAQGIIKRLAAALTTLLESYEAAQFQIRLAYDKMDADRAEISSLRAENERLREALEPSALALEEAAKLLEGSDCRLDGCARIMRNHASIARAALQQGAKVG